MKPTNQSFYEDYYRKPGWWFKYRYDTQQKVKTALYALKKSNIGLKDIGVLEIGFGSGDLLFKFGKGCSLYGVELSSHAVKNSADRARELNFRHFDFRLLNNDGSLPFKDIEIDLVIGSHVIEHIEDLDSFLDQIKRILVSNGLFLVLIPINERYNDPKHLHHFSSEKCIRLFQENHFECIFSMENEFLNYLVEDIYWRHVEKDWNIKDNIKRIVFNFSFSRLPYTLYKFIDSLFLRFTNLKPRQAVFIFQYNASIMGKNKILK